MHIQWLKTSSLIHSTEVYTYVHHKTYRIIFLELSSERSGVIIMRTWSGQGPPYETWECNWHGKRQTPEEEENLNPDLSWILTVWAQFFSWGRFSVSWNKTSLKWYEKLWSIGSDPLECHTEEALSLKSPEEKFEPCQHLDFRLIELILDVQSTEL